MEIKSILIILTLLTIFCFCGCSQNNTENPSSQSESETADTEILEVHFVYSNNSRSSKNVLYGTPLKEPTDPVKSNYTFIGWTKNRDTKELYDFSTPVTENFSLYPIYEFNKSNMQNSISSSKVNQSIVKITNKNYNTFLGFETSSEEINGTGVIFNISNGYCYILTTQDVIEKIDDYENQEFVVTDYEKNEYNATIYQNTNKTFIASSEEHNLAVLVIHPKGVTAQLKTISFADSSNSEDIVMISNPANVIGSTTYRKYITLTQNNTSKLKFDVIHCSGYSSKKTSGSPLLNTDLELIGIRYDCKQANEEDITLAIPIKEIQEFLYEYVYN